MPTPTTSEARTMSPATRSIRFAGAEHQYRETHAVHVHAGECGWMTYGDGRHVLKVKASRKGTGSVEEGIEFLKGYDIIVHPRCKHVIDELSTYSYEIDTKTEEVLPRLEDKKNHTIDSLRYAVEGIRRAPVPASFAVYGTNEVKSSFDPTGAAQRYMDSLKKA